MSCYGGWEVALPETEAFGCVLPWNGKVCDSGATDLLYGARSNRPFLSTQELEWWLIRQYHCQGNWFCEDLVGVIVLPGGRHPNSLQRQQAARTDCDTVSVLPIVTVSVMSPIFAFYPVWHPLLSSTQKLGFLDAVLGHQIILTFEGCFVESPNKLLQMYLLI